MTIEFETLEGATITAPLHGVLYIRGNKQYGVVMANNDALNIDQANYNKIRAALCGFEEVEREEKS